MLSLVPRLFFIALLAMLVVTPLTASQLQDVIIQSKDLSRAADTIAGRGIVLPGGAQSRARTTTSGGSLEWRLIRDETDPRGNTHKFYRQVLLLPSGRFDLLGTEVGVHAVGEKGFVGGTQAVDASIANIIAFSAADAVEIAASEAAATGLVVPPISESERAELSGATTLALKPIGADFSFVYMTPVIDARRLRYEALIDAESGRLVDLKSPFSFANCNPTTTNSVSATGYPVHPSVSGTRSLGATSGANRYGGQNHDGNWRTAPYKYVYQATTDANWQCSGEDYTLFPVPGTTPVYDDSVSPWKGRIAGDALHQTNLTMSALSSMGRNSWDGSGAAPNILIELGGAWRNNAAFFYGSGGSIAPDNSVALGLMDNGAYPWVVALDSIAHEWGHGVVKTSANFHGTDDESKSIIEGFCDFIAIMTEKKMQPSGTGVEQSSDWRLGEDLGAYIRSGEDDDGASGRTWYGNAMNDALHRQDAAGEYHGRGNMLNVVYRLLVVGGTNPVCVREPNFDYCTISVNPFTFDNATGVLYDTLIYYAPSTSTWATLPTYASQAAFFRFANCSLGHSALAQQEVVNKAFKAIGYARQTGPETCN